LRSGDLTSAPAYAAHLGKFRSLVPSLALLDHLAEYAAGSTGGAVSTTALERAIALADYLDHHARKLYAVELDKGANAVHRLAAKIQAGAVRDGHTARDIYNLGWSGLDRKAVALALPDLEQRGWLRVDRRTGSQGGRPSEVITLRPRLLEALATAEPTSTTSTTSPDGTSRRGYEGFAGSSQGWCPKSAPPCGEVGEIL
jgi:Protein of unknown function (DUF3987)